MHYILNTTFTTPGGVNLRPKIGGPTRIGESNNLVKNNTPKNFKPGESYILVYIKKSDSGVEYTFKSLSDNSVVVEKFVDCNEADSFIATMRGEKLPNYQNFYESLKS